MNTTEPAESPVKRADTCSACRFFSYQPDHLSPTVGFCRRRAPTPSFVWPRTIVIDWCGEFEASLRDCCEARTGRQHKLHCEHFIGPARPPQCPYCGTFDAEKHDSRCLGNTK